MTESADDTPEDARDGARDGRDAPSGPTSSERGPARVPITPPPEAEGELDEVYRSMGARREVANILGVQSMHPAALSAHVDLYRALMFGASPLSRAERESVAVVVSAANDCFY